MNGLVVDMPVGIAVLVAVFLLAGASMTLIGAVGFLRLPTFYQRLHAPTLGTGGGVGGIMLASMIFFSSIGSRPVPHELLIGIFVTVTTPITFLLLARAALHRDRVERNGKVPAKHSVDKQHPTTGSDAGTPPATETS